MTPVTVEHAEGRALGEVEAVDDEPSLVAGVDDAVLFGQAFDPRLAGAPR